MNTPTCTLTALPVTASAADVTAALPVYRDLLAGRAALLPVSPDDAGHTLAALMGAGDPARPVHPGTLIACTSGSTGTPKGALLRTAGVRAAVDASASFIEARYGTGPGPWLLALPPHHIAGTMVVLRSLDAGFDPAVLGTGPFTTASFVAATEDLAQRYPDRPLYTSLVPTQLIRLLGDAATGTTGTDDAHGTTGVTALQRYAGILVGGGPTPPPVVDRCRDLGITVLLTYGSSETSGGVLYDGEVLPGYRVDIVDPDDHGVGRVELTGPSVADGYRVTDALDPAVAADAFPRPGTFRTSDLGRLDMVDGREVLTVLGRADGAVNSGGLKILPEQVEKALAEVGVTACAVGVPDPEWGEAVAVLVEDAAGRFAAGDAGTADGAGTASSDTPGTAGTDCTAALRVLLREHGTASHLMPRRAVTTTALPLTGPGKLDRMRVRGILGQTPA